MYLPGEITSMTDQTATVAQPWFFRIRFYYGWVNLFVAAVAMVATLPGRSVGIGLITEPLLKDLSLSRVAFGEMTFWATLIGASFNLICGPAGQICLAADILVKSKGPRKSLPSLPPQAVRGFWPLLSPGPAPIKQALMGWHPRFSCLRLWPGTFPFHASVNNPEPSRGCA